MYKLINITSLFLYISHIGALSLASGESFEQKQKYTQTTITDLDQNGEENAPLIVHDHLSLETTEIKRVLVLEADSKNFQVQSNIEEKDAHVFESIQALDLSLTDLVAGFMKTTPKEDKLFIVKSLICKKDYTDLGKKRFVQLESLVIENRAADNYKRVIVTDIDNACCYEALWDEQSKALTPWEEISLVEKDATQEMLVREFWGVRSKRKTRLSH